MNIQIRAITAAETLPLRAKVLRNSTRTSDPSYPEDLVSDTIHFGAFLDLDLVGTSTWANRPWQQAQESKGLQIRGMAVVRNRQGLGIGKLLLKTGLDHARLSEVRFVWAIARDSALGFYIENGFSTFGDGFIEPNTNLPHHLVYFEISRAESRSPK